MAKRSGLPPLQRVPHLERLLSPNETIIYTAKLHPMHGWPLGLLGIALLVASLWWLPLLAAGLVFMWMYALPFKTNEVAVTTHRLLMRVGHFKVMTRAVMGKDLHDWKINQLLVENVLHCGTVTVMVSEDDALKEMRLAQLWHPLTFVQALETLQPDLRKWDNAGAN